MNDISRKEKKHRRKMEDQNMVRKRQQRRKNKIPESERFKHKKTLTKQGQWRYRIFTKYVFIKTQKYFS